MIIPYVIGVVTAPLVATVAKPLLRGAVKVMVGVALEVKRLAADASEQVQDIAAEVEMKADAAKSAAGAASSAAETAAEEMQSRSTGAIRKPPVQGGLRGSLPTDK